MTTKPHFEDERHEALIRQLGDITDVLSGCYNMDHEAIWKAAQWASGDNSEEWRRRREAGDISALDPQGTT